MQRSAGSIKAKVIASLMLVMMGMLIANKVVFIHTHKTTEGKIVTHCHPYNKSNDTNPFKSHSHSKAELVFLENLKLFLPSLILNFVFIILSFNVKYTFYTIFKPARIFKELPQYRAPPVL